MIGDFLVDDGGVPVYMCIPPRFPCCGAPRSCLTGLASSANAMGKGCEMAIS